MSELEKLRERHRKEVQELMKNCSHDKVGYWDYYYKLGRCGIQEECCLKCGKVLDIRTLITYKEVR